MLTEGGPPKDREPSILQQMKEWIEHDRNLIERGLSPRNDPLPENIAMTSPTGYHQQGAWRQQYGFLPDQKQIGGVMSPQVQDYWAQAGNAGNLAAHSLNRMPGVLNPADMYGHGAVPTRDALQELLYGKKEDPAAEQQPQQSQPSLTEQLLGLIQSDPAIMQAILAMQPQVSSQPRSSDG
jgi:hypothetical protein